MSEEVQKVALPAFLRKQLKAFRVGKGDNQVYVIKNERQGLSYNFEPWQFFILEVLPGCDNFEKLASVFEDRFGHPIKLEEVEGLFSMVADNKLFGLSAISHPMLASFNILPVGPNASSQAKKSIGKGGNAAVENQLPAGIRDAAGFDDSLKKKGWKLFDPSPLIKLVHPAVRPLKSLIYLLPTLVIAAFFITFQYFALIEEDVTRFFSGVNFFQHVIFSMFTDNVAVATMTALVAYTYRATVSAFCIVLYLDFFPRFMVQVGHVKQLSRRERIWLHATPLLVRVCLYSIGILLWFYSRSTSEFLPAFGLALSGVSALSFSVTANPLIKNSGYLLLSTYLNEPYLRGKAFKALLNKFRGNVYQESDSNVLVAYALASSVFMLFLLVVVVLIVGKALRMQLGGAGILLTVILAFYLIRRTTEKLKKVNRTYERSTQFERWRKRTVPDKKKESVSSQKTESNFSIFLKTSSILFVIILLFVPYRFQPGGSFVVLSGEKQEVTSAIGGLIKEVYYDGGEFLKKGTLIARLDDSEFAAQEKIYAARILEQQAVVNELKSRPRPEEVNLAERALEVEKTRANFSKAKLNRLENLYKDGATSFEELDEARKQYQVDIGQVEEKLANLEMVNAGASDDEIAAAEAKLLGYEEQRNYYNNLIEQAKLYMPFDGSPVTLQLKQKIGSYLVKGEPFTIVENTEKVLAQIDVPEADIGYVAESAKTFVRPVAFSDKNFNGIVADIDVNVEKEHFGKVVRVITLLENKDGLLKPGMTGYAKIESETLPVWKIFWLAFARFVQVEVWSWIP